MKKLLRAGSALLGLYLCGLQPLYANVLNQSSIRDTIAGKRIYLAVPLGGEFPLYYRKDGRVDGSGEAVGLGKFMRPQDKGRWWVEKHQLCQQWENWYEGKPFCFELRKIADNKIEWKRDDGLTGIARLSN